MNIILIFRYIYLYKTVHTRNNSTYNYYQLLWTVFRKYRRIHNGQRTQAHVKLDCRIGLNMHYVVSGRFMLVCRCLHRLRHVKCRLKIARPPILTWTQWHRMLLSISSRPTPPQNCTKRRSSSRLRHPCISCWWQARGEKAWRNWETMKTQWRGWHRGGGCCFEHLCTVTAVL